MKITNLIVFSISLLLIQSIGLSQSMAFKNNTVESGSIPADFGKNVKTLLIIVSSEEAGSYWKMHRSYKKSIQKYVDAGYTGAYKIVDIKEKSAYLDSTDKYRYYFFYDIDEDQKFSNGTSTTTYTRKFYVYDAPEKKKYPSKVSSSAWGKIATGYLMALDAERKKAQSSNP